MKKYLAALPLILCSLTPTQAYDEAHANAVVDALVARDSAKGWKRNQVVTVTAADLSNFDFTRVIADGKGRAGTLKEIRKVVFVNCNLAGVSFSGGAHTAVTEVDIQNSVVDGASFHYGAVTGLKVDDKSSFHEVDMRSVTFHGENVINVLGDDVQIAGSSMAEGAKVSVHGTDVALAEGQETFNGAQNDLFEDKAETEDAAYKGVAVADLDFTAFAVDPAAPAPDAG